MKYFLFPFFILLCTFYQQAGRAQEIKLNKEISVSARVECIDSEYVLIPSLKILSDTVIQIHKKLKYGNEVDITADCRIYLQKLIGKVYVNIYVEAFRQLIPDDGYLELKNVTKNDTLYDTINLKMYAPLEPGEYRAAINFKYFLNGVKHEANSDWNEFKVTFSPKNSIFN